MGGILMAIGLVASMGYATLIGPPAQAELVPFDEAEIGADPTDGEQLISGTEVDGGWQTTR